MSRAESSLRRLVGDPVQPEPTTLLEREYDYPRTIDSVYWLLKENEGKRLTARSIETKLGEEGLLDPSLKQPYGTVLDAARRLALKKPEITRSKRGGKVMFSYRSKNLPDPEEGQE